MNRLAVFILAGATIVAAQTATETTEETSVREKSVDTAMVRGNQERTMRDTAMLREKFNAAIERALEKADTARAEALRLREEMRGKVADDTSKIMKERREQMHARLQNAIEALEKASEKVGAQVGKAQERTQSRLLERRDELIELQKRILERQQTRGKKGSDEVTDDAAESETVE